MTNESSMPPDIAHSPANEWMSVEEMGNYLHIGRSTAYELTRQQGFPVIKIGKLLRIHRSELHMWLQQQRRETDRR